MKILFLSDLHLGSALFESDAVIISLLNKEYDKIFLVGDTIDVWEDIVGNVIINHVDLLNKINELDNVYVVQGNHDPSINRLKGVFPNAKIEERFIVKVNNKVMLVTHGDDFDYLVTKYCWLTKILFPFHWLGEFFGLNIKDWFKRFRYSLSSKKDKDYYTDLVLEMEQKLVNNYKSVYDYIVVGHTHLPKIVETEECTYVNCGDWIESKTYVIQEDEKFTLMEA
jgi:UDP-2,3-diacylglucosamine hydrolase